MERMRVVHALRNVPASRPGEPHHRSQEQLGLLAKLVRTVFFQSGGNAESLTSPRDPLELFLAEDSSTPHETSISARCSSIGLLGRQGHEKTFQQATIDKEVISSHTIRVIYDNPIFEVSKLFMQIFQP